MPTSLLGLLGDPVRHSVSPAMMNAAFQSLGMDAVYLPFHVGKEMFDDAVRGLQALNAVGANATIPHKEAAFRLVDELTVEAEMAGAVNCLKFTNNSIAGHNTDIVGFWRPLEERNLSESTKVVVIGAGGAARAVLAAFRMQVPKARICVIARDIDKAARFVEMFGSGTSVEIDVWDNRMSRIADADVIVHTTPVGMWPQTQESVVVDAGVFSSNQIVYDLIYRPRKTQLLEIASRAGAVVIDGLDMLLEQGVAAFEWWFSRTAPRLEMTNAVVQALKSASGES